MEIIALTVAIVSIVGSSYTTGNMMGDHLMVRLGGSMERTKWSSYNILLDKIIFWVLPAILLVIAFKLWGLLFIPIIFFITANLSSFFLKKQLQKRLPYKQGRMDSVLKSKDAIAIKMRQHEVNQLAWLISHPKAAQHLAMAKEDGSDIDPRIASVYEQQVAVLDRIAETERLSK